MGADNLELASLNGGARHYRRHYVRDVRLGPGDWLGVAFRERESGLSERLGAA